MAEKRYVSVPLWLWVVFFVLQFLGSDNWVSAVAALLLLAYPWWSERNG